MIMQMLKRILVPVVLFVMSATAVQAQETTLTLGVPEVAAANGLSATTISTADVDLILRTRAPSLFGQNFTRDKANKAFADFANFRVDLASSLARAIPAASTKIRQVNSVSINTNNLNLKLSQKTNSVSGILGTLSADISILVSGIPVICPSANTSFSIKNIMVAGDYNFITGDVSATNVSYTVENISTSCNGFFGFLGDALNAITGLGSSSVRSAVADAANRAVAFSNMKQLFSLSDFANGLSRFRSETPLSVVANRAIMIFQEMVNDAAINTPGIVLDFKVELATSVGGLNKISILASHSPAIIDFITVENEIQALLPANSERTDFYYKTPAGTSWIYFATASGAESIFGLFVNQFQANTKIIAVSRSAIFPGLQGFPSNVVGVKRANPCGANAC
jgi:hypothetical protein